MRTLLFLLLPLWGLSQNTIEYDVELPPIAIGSPQVEEAVLVMWQEFVPMDNCPSNTDNCPLLHGEWIDCFHVTQSFVNAIDFSDFLDTDNVRNIWVQVILVKLWDGERIR